MSLFLFYLHFHFIESLAIDADDTTLTDEGIGIDALDESENAYTLTFACKDAKHFHILSCVPSMTIENGHTMLHFRTNSIGYFLVFL